MDGCIVEVGQTMRLAKQVGSKCTPVLKNVLGKVKQIGKLSFPRRCCAAKSSQAIWQKSEISQLIIVENLREAGYGSWEGRTPANIKEQSEDEYWEFFADPVNNRPADAEPLEFFTPRINEVFGEVLTQYQGQHVLLVSHLAVTRAIIGIVLGMPLASQQLIDMPFAGMLRIINGRKGLRLLLL